MQRIRARFIGAVLFILGTLSVPAHATPVIQQLAPSVPSPQRLGTTVTWETTATDADPGMLNYRYEVLLGPLHFMVRDFSLASSFLLTLTDREGLYQIRVTVLNTSTNLTAQLAVPFQVNSLVVGTNAVATATSNPLVALLSAPSCPAGSLMRGVFLPEGDTSVKVTHWKRCQPPASMNFHIAGMPADSTTLINYQILTGTTLTLGPTTLSFNSGPLTFTPPPVTTLVSPDPLDPFGMVLHDYLGGAPPIASDLKGNVLWYYPALGGPDQPTALLTRPLLGTMLVIVNGINSSNPAVTNLQILREIDLAGNTLRETNATLVAKQLAARGVLHAGEVFGSFHHDAIRLPNGNTILLGSVEKIFPPGTQGSTDPLGVDIIGDVVVVLDTNWQVIWGWNSFDHLDVNRAAVLGEVCHPGEAACPSLLLTGQTSTGSANDWLHSNSIYYIPSSGDLLLSIRHQDWVVKIDYKKGLGTGSVLWRLGLGGDFTMNSTDPYPWFSHQHDAAYEGLGIGFLTVFDNGNTRAAASPGTTQNSRGQLLRIDEANMQVSLQMNADLGVYGFALGSAQLLPNGNAHFQVGITSPSLNVYSIGVRPDGTINYEIQSGPPPSYRSWRMRSLYAPPN